MREKGTKLLSVERPQQPQHGIPAAPLHHALNVPGLFEIGLMILGAATVLHILCVAVFGSLPRLVGLALVAGYVVFLAKGFWG